MFLRRKKGNNMAKDDKDQTQQVSAVQPSVPATPASFADKVEDLMNHAYQQSHSDAQPEHHQKFADWCNHLGDLLREVRKHA